MRSESLRRTPASQPFKAQKAVEAIFPGAQSPITVGGFYVGPNAPFRELYEDLLLVAWHRVDVLTTGLLSSLQSSSPCSGHSKIIILDMVSQNWGTLILGTPKKATPIRNPRMQESGLKSCPSVYDVLLFHCKGAETATANGAPRGLKVVCLQEVQNPQESTRRALIFKPSPREEVHGLCSASKPVKAMVPCFLFYMKWS